MYNVSAATRPPAHSTRDTCENPDIKQQPTAAIQSHEEVFEPVTGAWLDLLLQKPSSPDGMTPDQKKESIESTLSATLDTAALRLLDAQLLEDVLSCVLDLCDVEQYLAKKAYEILEIPTLQLLERGEEEPNSRTFNSVLPSFAASTYDYGVLGRTLLWKGACQLFAGSRNAERSDKLRQAIFSFPNPPKPGEKELKQLWEFCMAVDGLGLDEKFDVEDLRQQQNRP